MELKDLCQHRHDLLTARADYMRQVQPVLDGIDKQVEAVEQSISERLAVVGGSIAFQLADGTKTTLALKPKTQYSPNAGEADQYWNWVHANNRFDLTTRTVLKSGVEQYIKDNNGELPPYMQAFTTQTLSVTNRAAAPTIKE